MTRYQKIFPVVNAVRWNRPAKDGEASNYIDAVTGRAVRRPMWAMDCKDHPKVQPVGYNEVNQLIGTSGCSPEEPYWVSSVMGMITTHQGRCLVVPGDWIIEEDGELRVVSDRAFRENYAEI